VAAEFNDNLNLDEDDREADISLNPNIGLGLFWPITKENTLALELGLGYRWYLDHPSIASVTIAPNSRFDYSVYFDHGRINVHDNVYVQTDPTQRPDLTGGPGTSDPTDFRRISNLAGFTTEWRPVRQWSLVGGYDYFIDRSLTSEFTNIDRDDHTLNAGVFYEFSPRFTGGLKGAYTFTLYEDDVQNDAISYTVGPAVVLKPSQFLSVEASFGYAVSQFEDSGSLADRSDFTGLAGQVTARHTLNSRTSHELRFHTGRDYGLNSNFYEILGVHYGLNVRLSRAVTLETKLGYEHYRASGGAKEEADRYFFYSGLGWNFRRHWHMGLGYAFHAKDSDLADGDYFQNRITFDMTRKF
jgi:hypothetical protein